MNLLFSFFVTSWYLSLTAFGFISFSFLEGPKSLSLKNIALR